MCVYYFDYTTSNSSECEIDFCHRNSLHNVDQKICVSGDFGV